MLEADVLILEPSQILSVLRDIECTLNLHQVQGYEIFSDLPASLISNVSFLSNFLD